MKHKSILDTRFFFATAPQPCPYIPGRLERRVVTELVGRDAIALHDKLSLAGFRRCHNVAYAPACPGCQACVPVRILVDAFRSTRGQRRVWKRNDGLVAYELPPDATLEQYAVFSEYQQSRHFGGDMSKMEYTDYRSLIEETPVDSSLVEFHLPNRGLIAACLMDRVENGLSAVYSFFRPEFHRDSLGTYMILWMVERARQFGLAHVYLGYWVPDSTKMSYKASFQPLEMWTSDGWKPLAP